MLGVEKGDACCFTDLPLLDGVVLCRVSHNSTEISAIAAVQSSR